MSRSIHVINAVIAIGAVGLLTLSLWPGYTSGLLLLLALPMIALLGLAWLFTVRSLWRNPPQPPRQIAFRWIVVAPFLVCFTYGMLRFYIPRRIAFRAVQEQFDDKLATATVGAPAPLNQSLGIYYVDQYAGDARGGVYFRTGWGPDGIGPDRMSYGFAYRPNPQGSPFGAARYVIRPLGGGWFWFQASDDWH